VDDQNKEGTMSNVNWKQEAYGFAFGVLAAVAVAVGLEVYNAVEAAPDSSLLEPGFWKAVGFGALVTAIRSVGTVVATTLGRQIPGVSQ